MTLAFKSLDGSQNEMDERKFSFADFSNAIYLNEAVFTEEILLIKIGSYKSKE